MRNAEMLSVRTRQYAEALSVSIRTHTCKESNKGSWSIHLLQIGHSQVKQRGVEPLEKW